jgi:hypothetical protein
MTGRRRDGESRALVRRSRNVRRRRTFHIAVEGERTEFDYLAYLRDELINQDQVRINVISEPNGLKPLEAVKKLVDVDREDERWALFDRDEHTRIPEAFSLAKANSIKVAFSHPSFDLWLLLHFQTLRGRQSGSSELVQSKLRAHNGFESFARPSKRLLLPQREALSSAHAKARGRARQMTEQCDFGRCTQDGHDPSCDPLLRDPSTDMWRLLDALGVTR